MSPRPNANYDSQTATTNRSMFPRSLSASAPAQTFGIVRSHWRQYQAGNSWCRQQSWTLSTTRRSHSTSGPPHTFSWREWKRPGVFPYREPRNGLHLSSGLMDRSDTEYPLKKRKSTEESGSGGNCYRSPKRPSVREQSPAWLHKVTGTPLPPGKFTPSSENQGPKTELKRQWDEVCGPQQTGSINGKPFDFSVMSYNILSQELLVSNAYLYKHCNPLVLDWRHRFPNIIKELEQHSADILCLQEVQEDHYEKQIKPRLESLGYHCEYKRRTGKKPDGCAVVFKRERFSLLACRPVEYFRRGIPLLDRDNVGLILLLRPVAPSAEACSVCVANTHLLYNPRRGDVKLAQLALLLAEIGCVAGQAEGRPCPVLLCGDLNSLPWSPLCSFIKERRLDYAGMPIGKVSGQEASRRGQRVLTAPILPSCLGISQQCQYEHQIKPTTDQTVKEPSHQAPAASHGGNGGVWDACVDDGKDISSPSPLQKLCIEHGLKLTSAYSHYLTENSLPEITTCHSRTAITVDYIFYSAWAECSAPDEQGLQLLSRLALVSEAELREVNLLPNHHHSSDHLPLVARFRLHF